MEPRRNYSANSIVCTCPNCGRVGLIGWFQHKKGWRNGRDYRDVLWSDGWTRLCRNCWYEDLIRRMKETLADLGRPSRRQLGAWEDDGGAVTG